MLSDLEWIALIEATLLAIAIGRALRPSRAPAAVVVRVEKD